MDLYVGYKINHFIASSKFGIPSHFKSELHGSMLEK